MLQEPLFLMPVFQDRIWGGTRLRDSFGYDIPTETTGECWGISALSHGPSTVKNGIYKGKTLNTLWAENPELFDHYKSKDFPLLTKILDAKTDLSVQVHPDDAYAQEKEHQPFGKTECWYIIDCEEGAEIVFGHEAHSPEEFQNMVDSGRWNELLRKVKVKPGDFFYVPSGTIHAIGGGIMILESQQSSDITYRVYDYDRKDVHGNKRDLHIRQSIDVTHYPHEDPVLTYHIKQEDQAVFTELCHEKYFSVFKWDIRGQSKTITKVWPFLLASVIAGEGELVIDDQTFAIKKGDHFILPATVLSFSIKGQAKLIVSHAD